MDFLQVQQHCQLQTGAELDFPFGPDLYVYKVKGKVFAILFANKTQCSINLKCDPDQAQALRDLFSAVRPGYHMNKKHWNTVVLDGSLPAGELQRQIEHSWQQVVAKLPRLQQKALALHASVSL